MANEYLATADMQSSEHSSEQEPTSPRNYIVKHGESSTNRQSRRRNKNAKGLIGEDVNKEAAKMQRDQSTWTQRNPIKEHRMPP
ncbi:hypothetical protein R1flu_024343 [Riccia fluitans]|uniref:Uncharacterized protein n=1 Tax=Riccia fluitans TaxID=41844 RepID=A0ABD1XUM0_9MARC